MDSGTRRFACTQCGKCCNRSPEVELSEASKLADIFVFRLLFRMYSLPVSPAELGRANRALFYERKRLLNAHAARAYEVKQREGQKSNRRINYLMISALAVQTSRGACSALNSSRCTIYERRPLTCRSVPFHYSRGDSVALSDLDEFMNTPGYRCDASSSAPVVLQSGVLVDPVAKEARLRALAVAKQDLAWKQAIVRAMKTSSRNALPSFAELEMHAPMAAMTTSMRVGWEIAVSATLLAEDDLKALLTTQLATIERELGKGLASAQDLETMAEMKLEYRAALER